MVEEWSTGKQSVWSGQLTKSELNTLSDAFKGWQALQDHYPLTIVPDGPTHRIHYGGKTVEGGDLKPPEPFEKLQRLIPELAYKQRRIRR